MSLFIECVANSPTATAEILQWQRIAIANGGTFTRRSKVLANGLLSALRAQSYNSKIVYLLPFLGGNLATARVPLRDYFVGGIATNTNFVDGDFSENRGLTGNGTTKILDSNLKPAQLSGLTSGTSNGGLGYWERDIDNTQANVEPIGCYNGTNLERYVLDLRSTVRAFRWGDPSTGPQQVLAAINAHYYGQRSSATSRKIYLDSVEIGSNTTSDSPTGTNDTNIGILGAYYAGHIAVPYKSRCAVAYMTDGTMTDSEIVSWHNLLYNKLIYPTGR